MHTFKISRPGFSLELGRGPRGNGKQLGTPGATFRQAAPLAGKDPVLSDLMNQSALWSGCADACGLCIRITVHCAEPASLSLVFRASGQITVRAPALARLQEACLDCEVEVRLILLLLLLFPKSPESRLCLSAGQRRGLWGAPLMPSYPDA